MDKDPIIEKEVTEKGSSRNQFNYMNERPVDDISLEFFYKPHTISLLTIAVAVVLYFVFTRSDANIENNYRDGFLCVSFFFLIISVLAFPNGPFTRPHPAVWRVVFGLSVIYLLVLQFVAFQSYNTNRNILISISPDIADFRIDSEKEYAVNCSSVTFERIYSHFDAFAFAHFFGNAMKGLLIRHYGICWTMSITWELTEYFFSHLLPNLKECWWDAIILDVLLCNGGGIWFGMELGRFLELKQYKWESIKSIPSTKGKILRALRQFTPVSWERVRWFVPDITIIRLLAIYQLVIFWQVSELNTFFLKHIFEVPAAHPLCIARILLIGLIVSPSLRQYYSYVIDHRCKRLGTQCWVFCAITITEAIICVKFGLDLFAHTQYLNIVCWLLMQLAMSFGCLCICVCCSTKQQPCQLENELSENLPADSFGNVMKANSLQPSRLTCKKDKTLNKPKES